MSQGLHQSNHSKTTQNYSVDAFSVVSEISNPELVSTSSAAPLGTIGGVPIRTRNSSTLSLANCQRALSRWLKSTRIRVGNACPSTPKALQPTWTGYKGVLWISNVWNFKLWSIQALKVSKPQKVSSDMAHRKTQIGKPGWEVDGSKTERGVRHQKQFPESTTEPLTFETLRT